MSVDCKNILINPVNVNNTTSCLYIDKFGNKTPELNSIARDIWFWCITIIRHIHISVAHVTGKVNSEADEESCKESDDTEWSLHDDTFKTIHEMCKELSDFTSQS